MAGALLGAWFPLAAPAGEAQVNPNSPAASTATEVRPNNPVGTAAAPVRPDEGKPASNASGTATTSTGVDEILKMMRAGVSAEVIKAYIEHSSTPYNLHATDIIALKEHGVPDDVTTALVKRSAALKMQAAASMSNGNTVRSANGATSPRYGRLDPESHDYFYYYYLYPRTLAAANQRLYSLNPAFSGYPHYGYGYYGPPPFGPFPPSAFGHR